MIILSLGTGISPKISGNLKVLSLRRSQVLGNHQASISAKRFLRSDITYKEVAEAFCCCFIADNIMTYFFM